jgi:hypothetical protein
LLKHRQSLWQDDCPVMAEILWHPRAMVLKYSADQVAWARRWYSGPLYGAWLGAVFPVPEDGLAADEGNGVTLAGLANLARVLTGRGYPLVPGQVGFGIGSDGETEFDSEQVRLSNAFGEEPGRSWYRPMDEGFPQVTGPSSIEGQATFAEDEACFDWREWCWTAGPAHPVPHHSLIGAYNGETPVMVNRKAGTPGYGVKEPGVAWVFRTEVQLR